MTGLTYTDSGLTAGTDYSYAVQARDTADQTGAVSGSVAVRTTGGDGGPGPGPSSKVNLGYFTNWGVYGRNYHVKNLVTSGSAEKITHINYAFGNVQGGKCTIGDAYADYDKAYTADQSVDGVADTWDQPLRGNSQPAAQAEGAVPAHQGAVVLRRLDLVRRLRPGDPEPGRLREVLLRPGGGPALGRRLRRHRPGPGVPERLRPDLRHQRPGRHVQDDEVHARRVRPGQPGHRGDHRRRLGRRQDRRRGLRPGRAVRRLVQRDDVRLLRRVGGEGPDGPALPAHLLRGHPAAGLQLRRGHRQAEGRGHPVREAAARHRLLRPRLDRRDPEGAGRHGHGPGGGTYEQGIEDYKVLKTTCPANGTVAGTAYAHCGTNWWSYDTPQTILSKMAWANNQGLGGAFFWEFSGDTGNGELVSAIHTGLG